MSTLLGRLRNPQAALAAGGSDTEVRASILENLQRMCRTRRGSMRTCPDYGLPDLSEMVHSFPDAVGQLRSALQHTIEAYEPRLTNVRVNHVPSATFDLVVRFEITATVVDPVRKIPLRFETQLNASRAVNVV